MISKTDFIRSNQCKKLFWYKKNNYPESNKNNESASLDLKKIDGLYQVIFWDGYSQSEIIENLTEKDAAKTLKRFMKKLAKNIN